MGYIHTPRFGIGIIVTVKIIRNITLHYGMAVVSTIAVPNPVSCTRHCTVLRLRR